MTNEEFLDFLEQRRLVGANVVRQLRDKASRGDHRITPRSILKFLVQKDLVSRANAKNLLQTILTVDPRTESSILGLAVLPDVIEPPRRPSAPPARVTGSEDDELTLVSDSDLDLPAVGQRLGVEPGEDGGVGDVTDIGDDVSMPDAPERLLLAETDSDPIAYADRLIGDETSADSWDEAAAPDAEQLAVARRKKKKKKKRPSGKKNEWDSPLLLLGGGGLFLLIATGALLYFLLFREQADDVLKLASDSFDSGSYSRAIKAYEHFVQDFPSHPDFSKARVRLGMTRLWQATEGTSNFSGALATAKQVIADIEDEQAFAVDGEDDQGISQAKRELSSLLTRIAKGLSEQAETVQDAQVAAQRVDETQQALALTQNTKYVPQQFRLDSELEVVRETLARVAGRRRREAELAETIQQMDQALASGDISQAFHAHKALLDRHAALREDPALVAKVAEIAAAERDVIKFVSQTQSALTEPRPTPIVASVAFAQTSGPPVGSVEGVAAIQIDGSLYGLRAADGMLLWRRFVGGDSGVVPLAVGDQAVATVDAAHDELVCVRRDDGQLLWRTPLGESLQQPALVGERLLVASDQGKLFALDRKTGAVEGYVQFSQPLSGAVATDPSGQLIYAVGRHSNVYTLAAKDLSCLGVFYLGHDRGSVSAPPVLVLNKLIVAENSGAQTSQLRVLTLDPQGVPTRQVAAARLDGLIVTSLLSTQRRLAAVSTQGAVGVFEIGSGDDETALTPLALRESSPGPPWARFGALTADGQESHLWIAGGELTKLAILPTGNRLPVRSLDDTYEGDAFDYPVQVLGGALIHVRRVANQTGVRAGAIDLAESRVRWQTRLAVPAAGEPAVDSASGKIAVGLSSGDVFQPDRQALSRHIDSAARSAALSFKERAPFTASLDLGEGNLLLGAPSHAVLVLAQFGSQPRKITLPASLGSPPVRWGKGFAVATVAGQIHLLDASTGEPLAEPFQPRLTPDKSASWLQPVVAGTAADARLVATDGMDNLYALEIDASPTPHLAASATGKVGDAPLITRLAAAGDRVFAGDVNGGITLYAQSDLQVANRADLGSAIAWGPYAASDAVLVGLETGEVALVDVAGQVRWRLASPPSVPVGAPLVEEKSAWIAYRDGSVRQIDLGTGEESHRVELGEWTATGPVGFGRLLSVTSADGALLFFNRP